MQLPTRAEVMPLKQDNHVKVHYAPENVDASVAQAFLRAILVVSCIRRLCRSIHHSVDPVPGKGCGGLMGGPVSVASQHMCLDARPVFDPR